MTTTGNFTLAREVTFTYTAVAAGSGGGGEDLTVFKVGFLNAYIQKGRHMHPLTPAGYIMERHQPGVMFFRAALGGAFDKTAAAGSATNIPTPGGVSIPPSQPGTLVIPYTTTGGSAGNVTHSETVTGFMHHCNVTMQGGGTGPPIHVEYLFVASAENASSTITTV